MKIYAFNEAGAPATETEIETPRPTGKEVLLRITRSGVCHSDVHIRNGELGQNFPYVAGHEMAGEVVAVGDAVTHTRPGDVRLVFPWIGCRACAECQARQEQRCAAPQTLGVRRYGGYADHVLVPHEEYLLDIEGMDTARAATLACSGLTAYGAVDKVVRGVLDDEIVVIGTGGVGLMGIAVLNALGYRRITAVDVDDDKLATARELGATCLVNSATSDAHAEILKRTGGGAAGVVDFVGTSETLELGAQVLAKNGTLVVVGLFGGELRLPALQLPLKNLTVRGSYVGSFDELAEMVALAKSGKLPSVPIIEKPLSAAAVTESLDGLAQGRIPGRIVLTA